MKTLIIVLVLVVVAGCGRDESLSIKPNSIQKTCNSTWSTWPEPGLPDCPEPEWYSPSGN